MQKSIGGTRNISPEDTPEDKEKLTLLQKGGFRRPAFFLIFEFILFSINRIIHALCGIIIT